MSHPHRTRRVRYAICAAASASMLVAGLSGVVAGPAAATPPAAGSVDPTALVYVYSISTAAPSGDIAALAAALDAAGYDVTARTGSTLSVHATAADRATLDAFPGARVTGAHAIAASPVIPVAPASQDSILPARLDGMTYETFYGGYRTVKAFQQYETDLAAAYPEMVKVYDYGTSFTGANTLRAVCITDNAPAGCQLNPSSTKARVLIMAQIHARELSTSELAWRLMAHLTDRNGKDADVTALMQSTEYWIVPQVNPDGIETVQKGITDKGLGYDSPAWQRKNMNPGSQACGGPWAFSQRGVDINRNHNSHWGGAGSSSDPCEQTYKGTSAASEPETTKLQDLFNAVFKDQRGANPTDPAPADTMGTMITVHSYSNLMLMPWGWTATHAPNDAGLRSLGFRLSSYNNYMTGQDGEVLYPTSGTTSDWAYDALGIASYTMEVGPESGACGDFHPPYTCQDAFWELNRPVFLYAGASSAAPYMLGQGPTTSSLKAKLKKTGKVKVSAASNDDAYGTSGVGRPAAQNVTEGRIYIGTAPWDGGTPTGMKIKGTGKSVTLKSTTAAGAAKQLAYIQGKDANGNWGPVAAVWIPAKKK